MRYFLAVGLFIGMLATDSPSWCYEPTIPAAVDLDKLSRAAEEPQSLKDFFEERTRVEVGFDETYNDNVLLEDNHKREDYISGLESRVIFSDPRGSLLYGASYIVDLFRYHHLNANAIDHRSQIFSDFDPGGRFKYRFDYRLSAINQLTFGPSEIDILRRSGDFQRSVTHKWNGRMRYALNDTNEMVPQIEYSLFDDQRVEDADTDRRSFKTIVDLDHDLKPGWTLFGGYEFSDVAILGNKLRSSEGHAARLGCRYNLTEITDLDLTLKFDRREWRSGQRKNDFNVKGTWTYQMGPRTKFLVEYSDEHIPSFNASRLQFRSTRPDVQILYELTPLTELALKVAYEKQRSGGRDVLTGTPSTTAVSSHYTFQAGIKWQVREQVHIDLNYTFDRSKTRDTTNHTFRVGIKAQL